MRTGAVRRSGAFLRDGEQFELDLFPGVPWGGRSARALTRGGSGLYSRPEPPGHEVCSDPMQLSLWQAPGRPHGKKRPRQAAGASLLGGRIRRRSRLIDILEKEEEV